MTHQECAPPALLPATLSTSQQIDVLGTRPAEELSYIRSDQALQFLSAMPYKAAVPWSTLFPEASEKALDLLDKMLQASFRCGL
jgi:hypothetical protein